MKTTIQSTTKNEVKSASSDLVHRPGGDYFHGSVATKHCYVAVTQYDKLLSFHLITKGVEHTRSYKITGEPTYKGIARMAARFAEEIMNPTINIQYLEPPKRKWWQKLFGIYDNRTEKEKIDEWMRCRDKPSIQ